MTSPINPSVAGVEARSSADAQLIDQARAALAKVMRDDDLASEGGWTARQNFHGLLERHMWFVRSTVTPTLVSAKPYSVTKAITESPDIAALLTFISTALPRLCDLADQALATPSTAPEGGEWRTMPVRPDMAMLKAMARYWQSQPGNIAFDNLNMGAQDALIGQAMFTWEAALAAAPQPKPDERLAKAPMYADMDPNAVYELAKSWKVEDRLAKAMEALRHLAHGPWGHRRGYPRAFAAAALRDLEEK